MSARLFIVAFDRFALQSETNTIHADERESFSGKGNSESDNYRGGNDGVDRCEETRCRAESEGCHTWQTKNQVARNIQKYYSSDYFYILSILKF